jgi:hypothetical protein
VGEGNVWGENPFAVLHLTIRVPSVAFCSPKVVALDQVLKDQLGHVFAPKGNVVKDFFDPGGIAAE